jgi:Fe-S-cluster-containing hydrogenase component 2
VKALAIDIDRCTGCRVCELGCSLRKVGAFSPAVARIHVLDYFGRDCVPVACFCCDRPPCVESCPVGALTKDETTGTIRVSGEKCVECEEKTCVPACPWGCVVFSRQEETAVICDLCAGDPECAKYCVTGALRFEEQDVVGLRRMKRLVVHTRRQLASSA